MGQLTRCPLNGVSCGRAIPFEDKTFFLAETEKPEDNRKRRLTVIRQALGADYTVRSALDEKGINAFTCKICEMIQGSAYGIADITGSNPNVLFELGVMVALNKPTIILMKRNEDNGLSLPSDLRAIEIIPFGEYIDILEPLKAIVVKLPPVVLPTTPIQAMQDINSNVVRELHQQLEQAVKQFQESMKGAKLDSTLSTEEKVNIPAKLTEKLQKQEDMLKRFDLLGFMPEAETLILRGNLHFENEKYNEALIAYNWCLELNPYDTTALYNRALVYRKLGNNEEALVDSNRLATLEPGNISYLTSRARTYSNLKRYEEALADCNQALKLKPNDTEPLNNRANVYRKLGKNEEALADCNQALKLKPSDASSFSVRGLVYSEMKRYKEALADCNQALKLKPNDTDYLLNRGILYEQVKRYEEALADFNTVLKIRPNNASAMYNLACCYSLQGKVSDALNWLEKAMVRNTKYRTMAKDDVDFANVRLEQQFTKLTE
ncbi:MAG: tetratricopeptide repeat protein [Dehalococcoidales bacterium]|nr:tetratricopeptide repeat protein [Dehalococcoidales bacterium]